MVSKQLFSERREWGEWEGGEGVEGGAAELHIPGITPQDHASP